MADKTVFSQKRLFQSEDNYSKIRPLLRIVKSMRDHLKGAPYSEYPYLPPCAKSNAYTIMTSIVIIHTNNCKFERYKCLKHFFTWDQ